ncbi:MAG: DUF4375 domain-containing protein [Clostridiales bacterium]|nr:DUF4375 domain-containing protein [Clostridiales bacterium]
MWENWDDAESPYRELMTYYNEVNNGGHYQYFDNVSSTSDLQGEMDQIKKLLSEELKANLQRAYESYLVLESMLSEPENEISDMHNEIMDECDDLFYERENEFIAVFEEYASKIEL